MLEYGRAFELNIGRMFSRPDLVPPLPQPTDG